MPAACIFGAADTDKTQIGHGLLERFHQMAAKQIARSFARHDGNGFNRRLHGKLTDDTALGPAQEIRQRMKFRMGVRLLQNRSFACSSDNPDLYSVL